jgi:ribonucleoside-triphosphate reductase
MDGGQALHFNLDENLSIEAWLKIFDMSVKVGANYWTYNVPGTICNECDTKDKRFLKFCPKCGSKNVDYITRIIGYRKRVSNFSRERQIEASKRFYHKGV